MLTGILTTVAAVMLWGPSLLSIGLPVGILLALMIDGIGRPSSSVLCPTVSRIEDSGDCVAITFDDGPDPEVTLQILDILNAHQAHATFFVIGRLLEQHLDVARRALADGHELGNHSWRHAYFQSMYSTRTLTLDIDRAASMLASLGLQSTPLYRAPIGIKSPPLARVALARALTVVAWSIHSRDTIDMNPERVAARVLRRIKPGDIVLLHDGHERAGRHRTCSMKALPIILAGLNERKLRAVTVSQLLGNSRLRKTTALAP